jgi:hypothetical protein
MDDEKTADTTPARGFALKTKGLRKYAFAD